MSDLWTPQGNLRQTELDVAISASESRLRRLRTDLYSRRYEKLCYLHKLGEIENTLKMIKGSDSVASLREFEAVTTNKALTESTIVSVVQLIDSLKISIADVERNIDNLKKKRDSLKTKILAFKRK